MLKILQDVENEVRRSQRLRHDYPWFDAATLASERLAHTPPLNAQEQATLAATWIQAKHGAFGKIFGKATD